MAEDRPGPDRSVFLEGDHPFVAVERETGDLSHDQELGAERDRLVLRARRQVRPADPAGEPEIVPDHRARPRLPARCLGLDHERAQPVRGGVDGGSETGRARPGDDEIVEPTIGLDVTAEHLGDLGVRRISERLVAEDHGGQLASVPQLVQHPPALIGIVGQELAGDGVARGQIKELLTARRPALAHDTNHRRPEIRHHQRYLLAAFARLLDAGEGGRRRYVGEDPVIRSESPLEHGRDRLQRGEVIVDHEQDGLRHGILSLSRAGEGIPREDGFPGACRQRNLSARRTGAAAIVHSAFEHAIAAGKWRGMNPVSRVPPRRCPNASTRRSHSTRCASSSRPQAALGVT